MANTKTVKELVDDHVLRTLRENKYNKTKTAILLDMSLRWLRNRLKEMHDSGQLDNEPDKGLIYIKSEYGNQPK